jgi:hypothetical protein
MHLSLQLFRPETHTKRQATQHGCQPSLLGDGYKGIETLCGEGKNIFVLGRQKQLRQNRNLLYRHDKPQELSKEGPLSFVLF